MRNYIYAEFDFSFSTKLCTAIVVLIFPDYMYTYIIHEIAGIAVARICTYIAYPKKSGKISETAGSIAISSRKNWCTYGNRWEILVF